MIIDYQSLKGCSPILKIKKILLVPSSNLYAVENGLTPLQGSEHIFKIEKVSLQTGLYPPGIFFNSEKSACTSTLETLMQVVATHET